MRRFPILPRRCAAKASCARRLRGAGTSTGLVFHRDSALRSVPRLRPRIPLRTRSMPLGWQTYSHRWRRRWLRSVRRELRFLRAFRGRQTDWGYLAHQRRSRTGPRGIPRGSGPLCLANPSSHSVRRFQPKRQPALPWSARIGLLCAGQYRQMSRIAGQRSRESLGLQPNEYRRLFVRLSVPCPRAWRRRWSQRRRERGRWWIAGQNRRRPILRLLERQFVRRSPCRARRSPFVRRRIRRGRRRVLPHL